jgi:hypothetical protein
MTNYTLPLRSQCCSNCRYARGFVYEKHELLQCCCKPPEYSTRFHPRWPTVYHESWCGSWVYVEAEGGE